MCEDRSSQKKLATDAMFKLEHGFEDQKKVKAALPTIHALEEVKATMKDDYVLNKLARKQFRVRLCLFFNVFYVMSLTVRLSFVMWQN